MSRPPTLSSRSSRNIRSLLLKSPPRGGGWPLSWFEDAHQFGWNLAEHRSFHCVSRGGGGGALHRTSLPPIIHSPRWHWCPKLLGKWLFFFTCSWDLAARPCILHEEITSLLNQIAPAVVCFPGGLLALWPWLVSGVYSFPGISCFSDPSLYTHQG